MALGTWILAQDDDERFMNSISAYTGPPLPSGQEQTEYPFFSQMGIKAENSDSCEMQLHCKFGSWVSIVCLRPRGGLTGFAT